MTRTCYRYRLFTEDKANLVELTSRYFNGATFYHAVGLWQGQTEMSRVIEVLGEYADYGKVQALAQLIRRENAQQAVYIETSPVELTEVTERNQL